MSYQPTRSLHSFLGALACAAAVTAALGATSEPIEHDCDVIQSVMEEAMTGGLCKKAVKGEATDEELERLVQLFEQLHEATPSKGSLEDWEERTEALLDAAKAVAEGEEGSTKRLGKAANCAACHKKHKP